MRIALLALLLVLVVSLPACAADWRVGVGPNLLQNPGFEEIRDGRPASWSASADVYTVDSAAAAGQHSLHFVTPAPNRYELCSQTVALTPGYRYELRARVRTQGVVGDDSGATVCLEWSDKDGKYLGGFYPDGKKGDTTEWTEVGGVSQPLPAEAARVSVSCYVRRGMTGSAWWDDVSLRRWRGDPMSSVLLSPAYRGWLPARGPSTAEVRIQLAERDLEGGLGAVKLVARLTPARTGVAVASEVVTPQAAEFTLRLSLPTLMPGRYVLTLDLVDKATGARLYQEVHRLERPTGPEPKSRIDEHHRLLVDGKPFFPLGLYLSDLNEEDLRLQQASPFNCLMPYGAPTRAQMDLAARAGLKVIYSIKDDYFGTQWCPNTITSPAEEERVVRGTLREFREHPALLAWYINDELPLSLLPQLEAHQRWVEQEDPNHPSWAVLYQVGEVAQYSKTFDVIGADPYPIPDQPASLAADWTRTVRTQLGGARAMWMVPQLFRWPEKPRGPSLAELRSMAWQCITEGATGLVFYSWFEIRADKQVPFDTRWRDMKQVAQEVKDMIPVLLSVDSAPTPKVQAPPSVHWTVRKHQGAVYLVLVNDSPTPARATVTFPTRPRHAYLGATPVALDAQGALTASLAPLGVNIYRIGM